MVGVTIGVGEYYRRLARHAARTVEEKTGLKTIILGDEHFALSGFQAPHHLKLRMFDLVDDESLLYFDADMVCLNPWSPERFARKDAVVAVAESARPLHVRTAKDWEIPVENYFNAGLLILNRSHRDWLRETELFVLTDKRFAEYDPYDQAALNITRFRLGLKLELLDRRYNWIGYGGSRLSYEVPAFMAHGLHPKNKFANVDFFEGRYKPPFNWHIEVNDAEMDRLKNQTLRLKAGDTERHIRFNRDGTIGPPYFPGEGQYWFVHNRLGSYLLAICSEGQILQQFEKTPAGSWQSTQRLQPAVAASSVDCCL